MVLAATSASTVSTIPVFLLGAMGLFVRSDLEFGQTQLGIAVSAFWLTMALGGITGGRVSQRLGATISVRWGVSISIATLVGIACVPSWPVLVVLMGIAGLANALTQPAVDLALFDAVPVDKLGLAFGIKQTALPGAALVSGIGVPLLASTVGWRWGFVFGALVGIPALVAMPHLVHRKSSGSRAVAEGHERLRGIVVFAVAFGLAMIAVSATGAFYVESAIAGGSSADAAGLFLAAGSVCGIVGRFLFAWRLGDVRQPLVATSLIMTVGGLGLVGFALVQPGWPLFLVTLVAIGAGWGWNGLLTFAVVSAFPGAAARASGYIVLGAATGGILGPATFGILVQHVGFSVAWIAAAVCFFAAAMLLVAISRSASRRPVATSQQAM